MARGRTPTLRVTAPPRSRPARRRKERGTPLGAPSRRRPTPGCRRAPGVDRPARQTTGRLRAPSTRPATAPAGPLCGGSIARALRAGCFAACRGAAPVPSCLRHGCLDPGLLLRGRAHGLPGDLLRPVTTDEVTV